MNIRLIGLFFWMSMIALSWGQSRSGWEATSHQSLLRQFPCGGQTILAQDFEGGLPTTWSVIDGDGLGLNPAIDTVLSATGWHARADFKDASNQVMASASWYTQADTSDDWLITEAITLGSNSCLSWYAYSQDRYFPESYEVRISSSDDIASFLANDAVAVVEAEDYELNYRSVNLSDYAGQTVYIAFRQTSVDQFILVLDDIRVAEVEDIDIGVYALMQPDAEPGDSIKLQLAVINYGSDTLIFDGNLELKYSIDGGAVETYTVIDSFSLDPNDTVQYRHLSPWVPANDAAYKICAWTDGISDTDASNDSVCQWVGIGTATNIEEELAYDVLMYPNPAHNSLTINVKGEGSLIFEIFDLSGRLLKQESQNIYGKATVSLDIDHIPVGLYLLRIRDESSFQWHTKFVKE